MKKPERKIKIADFGLANKVGVGFNDQNSDKVGTTIYEAPEQINGVSYGKANYHNMNPSASRVIFLK